MLGCCLGVGRVVSGGYGRGSRLRYLLQELGSGSGKVLVWGRGKRRESGRETRAGRLEADEVGLGS